MLALGKIRLAAVVAVAVAPSRSLRASSITRLFLARSSLDTGVTLDPELYGATQKPTRSARSGTASRAAPQ